MLLTPKLPRRRLTTNIVPRMASTGCLRCLVRPSISSSSYAYSNASSRLPSVVAFSTTANLKALPVKKKTGPRTAQALRQGNSLRIKKKAFVKTGKPPAPGERKALRKRIVLSNTNAFEVPDMVDMTATLDPAQVGTVVGIPGPVVDKLRTVEAFKTTQGWGMFRRPGCLVRAESIEMVKILEGSEAGKKTSITVLEGERGTGKSMVLLQAMATAFLKNWIVVHIPDGEHLTAARTEYSPIPVTAPTLYSQNTYVANLLGQISKANEAVLSKLQLSKEHKVLPVPIKSDTTLFRLAELGSRDVDVAWPVFQAFWSEISAPGRPSILFALDGLADIMKHSAYRSPKYELIHAHDLALVKLFVDYFSGTDALPNGGAVIAATNRSLDPKPKAMDLALKQLEERQMGKEITKPDPFTNYDMRAYKSLKAAGLLKLKGLSKVEVRGLMEYWAASGVLRARVDEKSVTESWALAGNGIVGEIERGALRMRI